MSYDESAARLLVEYFLTDSSSSSRDDEIFEALKVIRARGDFEILGRVYFRAMVQVHTARQHMRLAVLRAGEYQEGKAPGDRYCALSP